MTLQIRQAARLLGVHDNTIRNWAARGIIRAVQLPGSQFRRIPETEVARLREQIWGEIEPPDAQASSSAGRMTGVLADDEFGEVKL